jgi:hypothetical protein
MSDQATMPWRWTPVGMATVLVLGLARIAARHAIHDPPPPPKPRVVLPAAAYADPRDEGAIAAFRWAAALRPRDDLPVDEVRRALDWSGGPDQVTPGTVRFGAHTLEASGVVPGADDPDLSGRWLRAEGRAGMDSLMVIDRERTRPGVYRFTATTIDVVESERVSREVVHGWEVVGPGRDCRYVDEVAVSEGYEAGLTEADVAGRAPGAAAVVILNQASCQPMATFTTDELAVGEVAIFERRLDR